MSELLFEAANMGRDGAVLSPCRVYRYRLDRWWSEDDCVVWIMLNPSTADATVNDATIRKCIGFSKRWGYGRMIVVNLFALRSTDPRSLAGSTDPVGHEADYYLAQAIQSAAEIICAWGCQQHLTTDRLKRRPAQVLRMIEMIRPDVAVNCLGRRKDGAPRHPLILGYETKRESINH